jgi:hypothetical protein
VSGYYPKEDADARVELACSKPGHRITVDAQTLVAALIAWNDLPRRETLPCCEYADRPWNRGLVHALHTPTEGQDLTKSLGLGGGIP